MSYNGSGTFQINTSGQPVVTGTSISSTVFNALTADLATGLSTAITKDGQTTTTARIPFALGINSTLVTDATNTTSGSIITAGGVGIAKALYVGTTANVAGVATLTSNPVLSAGTANGVAYLNGSKVLTTGSALVFDGTNLGVGATSLSDKLTVGDGTISTDATVRINGGSNTGKGSGIRLMKAGTAYAYIGSTSWLSGTGTSSNLSLSTTGNPDVNLDTSGNLLVGQTTQSNGEKFGVVGSNAAAMIYGRNTSTTGFASQFICDNASWTGGAVSYFGISGFSPNNTARGFLYASDSTSLRFQVYSNGGIANYAANNVILSDRREKTNFAPAGSYLDKICAIPVQTFNYIDQNLEEDAGLTLGVVAQDVQTVAPELVAEGNWGSKEQPKMRLEIYQTDMQYALMKCIQEQQALITQLTARITALESA